MERSITVAAAWLIIVISVPVVWVVGYQDHPWRNSFLAGVAGIALIAAAISAHLAGRRADPPLDPRLSLIGVAVATAALGCALLWGWLG